MEGALTGSSAMDLEDNLGLQHSLIESAQHLPLKEATPSSSFDLETYAAYYTGRTKLDRLKFIAQRAPSLRAEASKMLLTEIKAGQDVNLYQEVLQMLQDLNVQTEQKDQEWVGRVLEQAEKAFERLEVELCQHKLNSIKEKVRMGHNDLGQHHLATGNLHEALKCFIRTRDYGTTSKHAIEMSLHVIKVGVLLGNYSHVMNYVSKAESALETPHDASISAKLRVVTGLSSLEGGKYKQAALKFTQMKVEVGKDNNQPVMKNIHPDDLAFPEVMAPQDVASYGGLCALATFDRQELAAKVMEDAAFKQFMELAPDMRQAVEHFYHSRYAACLGLMDKIRGDLELEIHMAPHVDKLYALIRSRALVQYFTPFASVRMDLMADAFNCSLQGLQKELSQLIMKKEIKARIDSHNKIIYARHADQEVSTFQRSLQMGKQYQRQTTGLLLRLDLISNDLAIRSSNRVLGPPRGDRDEEP